jgi:hypothetical protein
MEQLQSDKKGFATLFSVLIVAAIGLTIAVSTIMSGIGTIKSSLSLETSSEARALANACAEEALQMVRDSASFSGTNTLTLGNGECTYTVNNAGGENRTITSSGTSGLATRKVNITIDRINPTIRIILWEEGF